MTTRLFVCVDRFALSVPNTIATRSVDHVELLRVELSRNGVTGRGESRGVPYLGDTAGPAAKAVERARPALEAGADREALPELFAESACARMATDSALWELESLETGRAVSDLAGLPPLGPLRTARTVWGADPSRIAAAAEPHRGAALVKIKLLGDGRDADRLSALSAALPDADLIVDANQGLDPESYGALVPALERARVVLVEQPFPIGKEHWLDGLPRPAPLAADESAQGAESVAALAERFDVVNIKLDKCGGLSAGLGMAAAAREAGLGIMSGCMTSSTLSMAPAACLAALADFVDLDGPLTLKRDREPAARYEGSWLTFPPGSWGWSPEAARG